LSSIQETKNGEIYASFALVKAKMLSASGFCRSPGSRPCYRLAFHTRHELLRPTVMWKSYASKAFTHTVLQSVQDKCKIIAVDWISLCCCYDLHTDCQYYESTSSVGDFIAC